ncbi:geranyl transferase, partial [Pyxidicoccus fallax]|uniref:polyprenyl synthetase family protein n=1 Tax=Pyxidicoccus fallax TaxID=394095 RepID=UPI001494C841
GMVGGQVLDTAEDRPAALDYLVRLHRLKTGALIRAACRMGVLAGGGDVDALARADAYGDAIGLAFQIADDVLDVTATPEQLGKPAGADAAAGRFTFPAVVGLEASKRMAEEKVAQAMAAVRPLEGEDGPLAALARYTVERKS